jgi:hypothetical protein
MWSEKLPFAGYSVVKERVVLRHSGGALAPCVRSHLPAAINLGERRVCQSTSRPKLFRAEARAQARMPELSDSRRAGAHGARIDIVENTGLEPVTSWLQTRRSPS